MYTRRGDRGETSLFGEKRVRKDEPRVEAYGAVDELNSVIGLAVADAGDGSLSSLLREVQGMLFVAGGDLAAEGTRRSIPRITREHTQRLEKMTDSALASLPSIRNFILPGGTRTAADLHVARAVCRRAERRVVSATRAGGINEELLPFFNRLSSLLFNLARAENMKAGRKETAWSAELPSPGSRKHS